MQLLDGRLVLSATDLTGFMACEHLAGLELAAARGELERPRRLDPELEVVARRGEAHEAGYLAALESRARVFRVPPPGPTREAHVSAAGATVAAMSRGEAFIYQAVFFDGRWLGVADFLRRLDRPSRLGPWSYEVLDTKLARRAKARALLQTCLYSEMLAAVQGRLPEHMHLVLGDGSEVAFRVLDHTCYLASARERLEAAVATGPSTYPEPVEHCGVCRWAEACEARRRADDHLSLVAGMRRDQAHKLRAAGIETLEALGRAGEGLAVGGIGAAALDGLRRQARLQLEGRSTPGALYELLPPGPAGTGLSALPEPSPGDVFFDMEGDPFATEAGLEYLFGVLWREGGEPRFRCWWAHDPAGEKAALEGFVDFLMARLERWPELHVFHYADYEPSALKKLMGRHATREAEVDRFLRGKVLVDLYRVVRHSLRASGESYSLKALEPLYMAEREGVITRAAASIAAYEEWLQSQDPATLESIRAYNEADCLSTLRLRDWLEERRREAGTEAGWEPTRPAPASDRPGPALEQAERESARLGGLLTQGVPEEREARSEEQQARWLLAQLLTWHRREARSQWWAHFQRLEMSDAELQEESSALGGLRHEGTAGSGARSEVHRYSHEPQEHKILAGSHPVDPRTGRGCGEVVGADATQGWIELRRRAGSAAPHPRSLIPEGPPGDTEQRNAIARLARSVAESGVDGEGPCRAARDLLLRRPPRLAPGVSLARVPGEEAGAAAVRAVLALRDGCLALQGPPGTGKTRTGAEMALELVRRGRRVGVTAASHRVISHFLESVWDLAAREGSMRPSAVQKAPAGECCGLPGVLCTDSRAEAESRARESDLVAGTAWLFAREPMAEAVDVLFVDEAGQVSLADVLAVGGAARNLVLIGDPNQLAMPSQGVHPPGADVSCLEHLLGDSITMPEDRGIFLDRTWRMHPRLCHFVSEVAYEGRLEARASCSRQAVGGEGWAAGAGIRYVPVAHTDNRTRSAEEAAAALVVFQDLLGRPWTGSDGMTRPLGVADILVVAPYNAQVALLRAWLPEGARVGTVDRFQGLEAPAVIYSMATSSAQDMPRGLDFLYSLNRLNVAVSRGQGLAVLVCSPALLRAGAKSPREMRLVNALCRLAAAGRSEPGLT
ncbi:MAG: TM0106 family RecB-like putative nuclease [Candidatus Dormibacterales bacterium]